MGLTPLPVNFSGGLPEMGAYIGTATLGWFWIVILLVIFIIAVVFLMEFGWVRATTMALFFCTILALPLRFLSYIGDYVLFIFVILTAVMAWVLYATSE
jgi:hypothetical protein